MICRASPPESPTRRSRRCCRSQGTGRAPTLLAAEKTGRIGRCIELDPHYVDAAIGRWQALTGKPAVHVESGLSFDELATQRHDKAA